MANIDFLGLVSLFDGHVADFKFLFKTELSLQLPKFVAVVERLEELHNERCFKPLIFPEFSVDHLVDLNYYDCLEIEEGLELREEVVLNQPISFLCFDYVRAEYVRRRAQSIADREFNILKEWAKTARDIIPPIRVMTYLRQKYYDRMRSYNNTRSHYRVYGECVELLDLEAQMQSGQDAQGSEQDSQQESVGNTLSETQRGASVGTVAPVREKKILTSLTSAENSVGDINLTNRFYPYINGVWSKSDVQGKTILSKVLPKEFVTDRPDAANNVLFHSYAYWNGDLEIKLMLNANKFQVGQLQMSWYYASDYEYNFDRRDNIFTASQQPHCLVSASVSNEGILRVPFRYYKPRMGTKDRVDDPGHLNMGRLVIRVLNRLKSTSTVYSECPFVLSVRYVSSQFSGMLARNFGTIKLEGQMYSGYRALNNVVSMPEPVNAAMKMLEELDMDYNRDLPPDVSPAICNVPRTAQSWCVGDLSVAPMNVLRLQAPGQTPHPSEVQTLVDEMSVPYVTRIFGLITTITWPASARYGTFILGIQGSPILDLTTYYSALFDGTTCYALPPVAVISSLFAYWRGSLELRFDIIASQFHTGRLIIAYIPRVLEQPTIEILKSSPHMIYDLQGESRQFVFSIPYIADRPWWHNPGFGSTSKAPSHVYAAVLNDLVPMDSVANEVEINIYMRAGTDFEVAVPVSPRMGLSTFNASIITPSTLLASTKQGYTPMFVGNWRYFGNSDAKILRYGNGLDHVTQFNGLRKHKIYEQDRVKNGFTIRGQNNSTNWVVVGIDIDSTNEFCPYGAYFSDRTKAVVFAIHLEPSLAEAWVNDSGFFDKANGDVVSSPIYLKEIVGEDFEVLEANMDERQIVDSEVGMILPAVRSTDFGRVTFGENFSDLKSLCRRYQMYLSVRKFLFSKDKDSISFSFPVLPQGMFRTTDTIKDLNCYNYNREGVIPIIASGYRFYRGGVRFRLVWLGDTDALIRVEHRPDEQAHWGLFPISGHRSYKNDGYAILIQHTSMNPVLEFEIPFYQCGSLGFLQHPKLDSNLENFHFSLGNVYVCVAGKGSTYDLDIMYSLADDCRFSVFQGFPMVHPAPDIPVTLEAQMFAEMKNAWRDARDTVKKVNEVATKVDSILPGETSTIPEATIEEQKTSFMQWVTNTVPEKLRSVFVSAFSQLVHCVINPTIKTIAWAFASFLTSVGILCSHLMESFSKHFKHLIKWCLDFSGRADQTKRVPGVILEANMDTVLSNNIAAGLTSTIVTSIATLLGCVGNLPKSVPDFTKNLLPNLGKFSLTSNHLFTFFRNNLSWITDAYKWTLRKVFPNRALALELANADVNLKGFVEEAVILLNENNARKIEIHPKWNLRLYACAAQASALLVALASAESAPKTPAILQIIRDVLKKRDLLVRSQLSPPIRFEPFVLGFEGEPNIGKSHLCQKIGKELLTHIGYKSYEEIIYTRTPGNPYWNGLKNSPICLYDDFGAIGGEFGLQQAAELFCLKSRAVFNPPQAAIEDKFVRYNPLLVFLASNDPFPKIVGVENQKAFFRRRDLLIKVEKNVAFYKSKGVSLTTGSPKEFDLKDIRNYEHLRFRVYNDSSNPSSSTTDSLSYVELVAMLASKFIFFYQRELELYMDAAKQAFDFYPDDDFDWSPNYSVSEQQKKISELNKYRYENIQEVSTFLKEIIPTIKNKEENYLPIILTHLRTLKEVNPNLFLELLRCNDIVRVAYESTGLEAQMLGEPVQLELPLQSEFCVHDSFEAEFLYERDDPTKLVCNGRFRDVIGRTIIPEAPCSSVSYCRWRKDDLFKSDMKAWLEARYCIDRQIDLKAKRYSRLPYYLIKDKLVVDTNLTQLADMAQIETKSWMQWAKDLLEQLGKGLWSIIKWAGKILMYGSLVFGAVGLARSAFYPEESNVRYAQKMHDRGITYNSAYSSAKAGVDAVYCTNAEISVGEHRSQHEYPNCMFEEPQMSASGDYKTFGKAKGLPRDVGIKLIGNLAKEQEMCVTRLIKRNTVFLEATDGTKFLSGRLLGLFGHYALTVNHYDDKFSKLGENTQVYLRGAGFKIPIKYSDLEYKPFQNSSLGYYKLPPQMTMFRNLLKHIARQKDHKHVGPMSQLIEVTNRDEVIMSQQICTRFDGVDIEASNGFERFSVADGYRYQRGGRGLCGSALVSDHLQYPIYGIHVAGDIAGNVGISEAITYEQFSFLIKKDSVLDVIEPQMLIDYREGFIKPRTNVQILGLVPCEFAHRETGVSKVIPTECHGDVFPIYCEPPVLSPKDERISDDPFSPMQEGIDKHGCITTNFPSDVVNRAYEDLKQVVLAKVSPVRGKVGKLPKSVAVVGDKYVPGFEKIDLSTSEGFPYVACRKNGMKSKRWLLDLDQDESGEYIYKGCDDMLRDIMKMKKEQRLRREIPFTVFIDCLKDRKLPLAKARQRGKVRIFSISPLDYTIQCRQYFMDFSVSYQNARLDVEHAVGIDVNSLEWTDLATRLLLKGNNIVTADYSGYGPSLNLYCAKKAIDIMRDWYRFHGDLDADNDCVREMLGYEIMYSNHLSMATIYKTFCGLPSGSPLTVILNSLVGCLYIRIAWMLNFERVGPIESLSFTSLNYTLQSFHAHCRLFVYGDDVIMSVSDDAVRMFNCATLVDIFSSYGIGIKNATKGDEIIEYSSLLDSSTTFLKNNFRKHPIRHTLLLASLDKTSVEDTLNWTFKEWQFKLREISLEASDACIRSAYGHGPVYFNYVRDKVLEYWARKGEVLHTPTWSEIDNMNFA